jgi:hypothetical protein
MNVLDFELLHNRIITGDLIIAEFLQGFHEEKDYLEAKRIMDSLEYHDLVGREIAKSFVELQGITKKGITVRKTTE